MNQIVLFYHSKALIALALKSDFYDQFFIYLMNVYPLDIHIIFFNKYGYESVKIDNILLLRY